MFEAGKLYKPTDPALAVIGSPSALATWRHEGRGPAYVKLGARVAYRGEDLNDWIESQTVRPGVAAA